MSASRRSLVLATRNQKKRAELDMMLADLDCRVLTLDAFPDCPEVEETGTTFEENACLKALAVAQYCKMLALADDSGLEVDALKGAPGVHSARYASSHGAGNSSDDDNNAKLLRELADLPDAQRTARFVCAVAIAVPDGVLHALRGTVEGRIAHELHGDNGFGYDPLFYHEPFGMTFGQVDAVRKASVSHRGNALRAARAWLETYWQ